MIRQTFVYFVVIVKLAALCNKQTEQLLVHEDGWGSWRRLAALLPQKKTKKEEERGSAWWLLNDVTLMTSQDPDVSLDKGVCLDGLEISFRCWSEWLLSQQRLGTLGTLEPGPEVLQGHFHDVKTVKGGGGGHISFNTAHWRRTGDLLRAECYFWFERTVSQ